MKKKLILVSLYTVIITSSIGMLGLMAGPYLYWRSLSNSSLNVWIVDKTVPTMDYREHKGLMWVLNHYKITSKETGAIFHYDKDYYGFFPAMNDYTTREIPDNDVDDKPDLIYLADTYGVYTDDFMQENTRGTRSDLIYGGLTEEEMAIISNNLGGGNTFIGEFNIGQSPTNQTVRRDLEKKFGLNWRGWTGRYFNELADGVEVPVWMVDDYERQYQKKWEFKNSGFVLVSDDDEVVVLEKDKHIGNENMQIVFADGYNSEFGIKKPVAYNYWFEWVEALPGREVIGNFNLDVTAEGAAVLKEIGLSSVFPAVIRNHNTQYTSYYFAGDFADLKNSDQWENMYGFADLKKLTVSNNPENNDYFYWKAYCPMMKKIINDIKSKPVQYKYPDTNSDLYPRIADKKFQVFKNGAWQDIFVKGVNLGAALPGKWFTEFIDDEKIYLEWFDMIGKMNANTIRIYTLMPPEFYHALDNYNRNHKDSPLWLFQEIWPEENPPDNDYLKAEYEQSYLDEIARTVDAIHGRANIPQRDYRAYGIYTSDVSPYILGYLVGRELEPDEVISTNANNPGFSFMGEYLTVTDKATATESWLAKNCDYLLSYEEGQYNQQHPVAIVSWPTLDALQHDSEWNIYGDKSKQYNDKASVDINNIEMGPKMKAGFFGAYHIYPNYPDFMNNDPQYDNYMDDQGRLRYGGYLQEFMEIHTKYPALVAEFGIATGMGTAHISPDGYNHGGLNEEEQGQGIIRMMNSIKKEGYAGGLVFEWFDEWAKKTWTTEPFIIPFERNVFWHNAIDPEQNYGLLAIEPTIPDKNKYHIEGNGLIKAIDLNADAAFLYLDINLERAINLKQEKLWLGLDTYDRNQGEFKYSPDLEWEAPSGLEFVFEFDDNYQAKLMVQPDYNIAKNRYASSYSIRGVFEKISMLINKETVTRAGKKIPAIYEDGSALRYGEFKDNSYNNWNYQNNRISVRIPWGRINVTDPSSLRVLNDTQSNIISPLPDALATRITDGVVISAIVVDSEQQIMGSSSNLEEPYIWKTWDVPEYQTRLKYSYYLLQEYYGKL